MATITRRNIRPHRTYSLGNFPQVRFLEDVTESVLSGDFIPQVCDLTSGRVRKANATAARASLASGVSILGVMADPFTNRAATSTDQTTGRSVYLAAPGISFAINVSNGFGNESLTAAMVGNAYGLVNLSNGGGSGIWTMNFAQTTNTYVKVLSLIDDVGDINGRVEVVFENDKIMAWGD